ncbi:50S ribosomal protein L15 [Candidatus Peregrinibacteria bacterium]|nr:50S ribosomal protein L15 [Candidatus Peregrinibacteria bacterium]
MKLNSIKNKAGVKKDRKRVGRGNASGHGTFSGRGCKGMGQRKSGNVRPGFEGGQTPLIMRLPKLKGFKNPNKVEYQVLNVKDLEKFKDGEEVNIESLLKNNLISRKKMPVKILGAGKITKKLTVKVQKISDSAREKIVKAGGKVI